MNPVILASAFANGWHLVATSTRTDQDRIISLPHFYLAAMRIEGGFKLRNDYIR